jgi:hypothetical protein
MGDGEISHASRAYFQLFGRRRWKNMGGDWLDANQTPQGTVPFASLSIPSVPAGSAVARTFSGAGMTALVQRWRGAGNRGVFFRQSGDGVLSFGSRKAPEASSRPYLTVVTSAGTFTCYAKSVNAVGNDGSRSDTYFGDFRTIATIDTAWYMLMQFDLSPIPAGATINSATMTLTQYSGSRTTTLNVFEIDAQPYVLADWLTAPSFTSLSDKYPNDVGMQGDPDVYMANNFAENLPVGSRYEDVPSSQRGASYWDGGSVRTPSAMVNDPVLKTTIARCTWGPYTGGVQTTPINLQRAIHQRPVNTATGLMGPDTAPNEAWLRYYVNFDSSFELKQGTKQPGIDGRFGIWRQRANDRLGGYYDASVSGNGQSRTLGTRTWNSNGYWEYSGWSARMYAESNYAINSYVYDADNPYRGFIAFGAYFYEIGSADPHSTVNVGFFLQRNKRYCIEAYVKMNSVVGPFDANNNGTPVADGVLRVYVNGVLGFEKTDVKWRANPEIGVMGAWADSFSGGSVDPSLHTVSGTASYDSFVIAKARIGLRKE